MVYGGSTSGYLGCHRRFALGDEKCRCCQNRECPIPFCYTNVPLTSIEVSAWTFIFDKLDFLGKWSMGGQPQGT